MKEFVRLQFPVHQLKEDASAFEAFTPFRKHHDFVYCPYEDRDQWIKFICYYYDFHSDLQRDFPDDKERMEVAAELAGFKRKNKGWQSRRLELVLQSKFIEDETDDIARMIVGFLLDIHQPGQHQWTQYCMKRVVYQQNLMLLIDHGKEETDLEQSVKTAKEKGNVMKINDQLAKEMEEIKDTLFRKSDELTEVAEQRLFPTTMEVVAHKKVYPRDTKGVG